MPKHHKKELKNDIKLSNHNLSSDYKILVPGSDNQIQFIRLKYVQRSRQFMIISFVDFCQSSLWTIIMLTIIFSQSYEQTIQSDHGFFSFNSFGLVYALGITAAVQPLVGFVSDHIGVRFSFILWSLLGVLISCTIPLIVLLSKQNESVEQILAANTNFNLYLTLLTVAILSAVGL